MNNINKHYFIAVELNTETKKWLYQIQQKIKEDFHYKNWVNQNDFHITLHFFGAINKSKLYRIVEQVEQLNNEAFTAEIGDLSTFGSPDRPRVLWVGVKNNSALSQLHYDVQQIVAKYVPIEKRTFTPHITLAKKWASEQQLQHQSILNQPTGVKQLHVNKVVIYEIHPEKKQKYQIWRQFELK
ncbi:RNA 2',3'-cyclic phosphodiesterase [Gracilibacillus salitolerans]|uniref:RNA 2',3'-cyclic phosphodiesterase n=1 Tax=Gracilibacillus salitolerans TaxID=2663022 RepID=A0A5Q2TNE1_9BACI|nr:RNA 2',3'-cyclic phosphodiesterase [Gracilibacillus salitolerans]QGH35370.1 RNA 2',3'-cyclic phosphodiesterase [Gracilibacillus salitolerans]